jgi:hypothetical protein
MNVSQYFNSLASMEKAYLFIAIAGTVFFLLQSLFTFLDLGDHFESDTELDSDVDVSFLGISLPFNLFSIRGIIGFIMIFGWAGLTLSRSGVNPFMTFVLSALSGFIMMIIIGLIYFSAMKLSSNGTTDLTRAIGKECEVYLTIPAKNMGMGKVHLIMNGSLKEYDAITHEDEIHSGETALVIEILNDKLVVKKNNK